MDKEEEMKNVDLIGEDWRCVCAIDYWIRFMFDWRE
jgi:hypothetical protein